MIKINFIAHDGAARSVDCTTGQSLMQAAVSAGVDGIEADCGGMLTCATCHVRLLDPHASQLPPADEEEQGMLAFTAEPAVPGSRLSCQVWLTDAQDGMTVALPIHQH